MYVTPHHSHYSPSSVGALMDPGFLRQVIHDTGEQVYAPEPTRPGLTTRLRVAMQVFVSACLRRLALH